jgi:DNA polymerase III gamma/tau subunit
MQTIMQRAWFEKYRPKTVDEVIFPDQEKETIIKSFINQGYIQGNILSYGPGGVGKTTINKVLLNAFIKHQDDVFILGRSVDDVDKLAAWIVRAPTSSKQRIVVCEEFDNLSSKALSVLKDGFLEKYQPNVAFICTTNNIQKLEPPLLQRFNIKLNFTNINIDGLIPRLAQILTTENVMFSMEEVTTFANLYKTKGIRDILNDLQLASISGTFNLASIGKGINSSGTEESILDICNYLFKYPTNLDLQNTYLLLTPDKTPIAQYYDWLVKIMQDDTSINYDYLFAKLIQADHLLPIKNILIEFYQNLEYKKFKHLHFIACIGEIFQYWIKVKS